MSEMERLKALVLEQGEFGCIPESCHYRANVSRGLLHLIGSVTGMRLKTSVERLPGRHECLLWYKVVGPR